MPAFDLRPVNLKEIVHLFDRYHGYGSVGAIKTYAFAVFEDDKPVAAYVWLPPPPGAARSVCALAPFGVLALSRMVAVPKSERKLKHISKPLKAQFKLIDRSRYPVLITYSDESQGHTGYVYQCSGMTKTHRAKVNYFEDDQGRRCSPYSNGKMNSRNLRKMGFTFINRWEHWICKESEILTHVEAGGWRREAIKGKFWKSGSQAYKFINIKTGDASLTPLHK